MNSIYRATLIKVGVRKMAHRSWDVVVQDDQANYYHSDPEWRTKAEAQKFLQKYNTLEGRTRWRDELWFANPVQRYTSDVEWVKLVQFSDVWPEDF